MLSVPVEHDNRRTILTGKLTFYLQHNFSLQPQRIRIVRRIRNFRMQNPLELMYLVEERLKLTWLLDSRVDLPALPDVARHLPVDNVTKSARTKWENQLDSTVFVCIVGLGQIWPENLAVLYIKPDLYCSKQISYFRLLKIFIF